MDRRKPVMNVREAAVDRVLADYAQENGYRIHLKMRLRDAIDTDGMSLTRRERDFAFTSHLDFVATDEQTLLPLLAVEYDGPQHLSDQRQIERDRVKNRLCEQAELPLLRIDNHFMRQEGKWSVLKYILWAHELGKAFHKAQEQGYVPWDEPFYHGSAISLTESGGSFDFEGLDIPALRYLEGFRGRHGGLWGAQWWRGTDTQVEARELMALANGQYLYAHSAVRQFAIEGIAALDIATELATAELGWLARRYDAGEAVAIKRVQATRLLEEIGVDETHSDPVWGSAWHLRTGWRRAKPRK